MTGNSYCLSLDFKSVIKFQVSLAVADSEFQRGAPTY